MEELGLASAAEKPVRYFHKEEREAGGSQIPIHAGP
jgi:hypothetical protein